MRTITPEEQFASPAYMDGPGRQMKEQARSIPRLERLPVSAADREKIAHGNAQRLMRIPVE